MTENKPDEIGQEQVRGEALLVKLNEAEQRIKEAETRLKERELALKEAELNATLAGVANAGIPAEKPETDKEYAQRILRGGV